MGHYYLQDVKANAMATFYKCDTGVNILFEADKSNAGVAYQTESKLIRDATVARGSYTHATTMHHNSPKTHARIINRTLGQPYVLRP